MDLNKILAEIANKLDLDQTRYQNALNKFAAVGKWLDAPGSKLASYSPLIFPQGSFLLGTSVKPISGEDYDIDLVFKLFGLETSPKHLKQLVGERLAENEDYRKILKEKVRCWRLIYARQFHLDILPAKPSGSGTAIKIPDKELEGWKDSDPQGYAEWFKSRMKPQFSEVRKVIAAREFKQIEQVPEHLVKTTLQKTVQLMKRNRDIEFDKNRNDKPAGILITTLAAHAYKNEGDLFVSLLGMAKEMPSHITTVGGVDWIANPVNPKENFADKWALHPKQKEAFYSWLAKLIKDLESVVSCISVQDAQTIIYRIFGESVSKDAFVDLGFDQGPNWDRAARVPPVFKIQNPSRPWKPNGG
ncbi:MAG: nucleotidyltransferase [Bacteroidota bacterium]